MDNANFFKYNPFAHFDANATKNRIIEVTKENETQIKRIFNVSLPFLHMYQPASTMISMTFSAYDLTMLITKTVADIRNRKGYAVLDDVAKMAFTTGTIAFSILKPAIYSVGSSSYELTLNLYQFTSHMRAGNYRDAAFEFLSVVHNAASVGLVVIGGPELLVVSLLAQAAKELTLSAHEFKSGRSLEALANIFLAVIRIKSAVPHMQDIYRNHYGKEMTQDDLNRLFEEIIKIRQESELKDSGSVHQSNIGTTKGNLINFNELLKKKNLQNKIKKLDFAEIEFDNFFFSNMEFIDNNFSEATINYSRFENITFKNCGMENTRIHNSYFYKTVFDSCNLSNAGFNWSIFNQSTFTSSDLTRAYFNDTHLNGTTFLSSNLFESSFFNSKVANSFIINSNLKDCLLFDTKDKFHIIGGAAHEITRTVIMLPFDFKNPGAFGEIIDEAINESGGIVFKIHYHPQVDSNLLKTEVKLKLAEYKNLPISKTESIAQYILENSSNETEVGKIKSQIAKAVSYIDGIAIPGGADIQPELYGKERELFTHPEPNYLRSIFEFAIIDQADKKDIPTLGICRGSQIVNVFFGGTLKQNAEGHSGAYHVLKLNPDSFGKKTTQIAFEILKGSYIIGLSLHHQASEGIGKGLDVVIDDAGSPELLIGEPKNGLYPNFVLTQFHPEMYKIRSFADYFSNNQNFFTDLISRASIRKRTWTNSEPQAVA